MVQAGELCVAVDWTQVNEDYDPKRVHTLPSSYTTCAVIFPFLRLVSKKDRIVVNPHH